jgi:formamidopyrimidine-DNA glycosylase
MTAGGALSPTQVASLVRSIKSVLRSGIEHRGTSISSYRDGRGEAGSNQNELRVYGRGRSGEPCLRCGQSLTWSTVGGRTSHFCPHCQRLESSAGESRQ